MSEITHIPFLKNIEPYFNIAALEAKKSPCVRRQYGALIAYRMEYPDHKDIYLFDSSHNKRISTCCEGKLCARDRYQTKHGGNVEIGGEIHAVTSLMISRKSEGNSGYFILVGFEGDKELYGPDVYPCHSCAMAIKYGGFNHIFIHSGPDTIQIVSINEVMEYRINQWEPVES